MKHKKLLFAELLIFLEEYSQVTLMDLLIIW